MKAKSWLAVALGGAIAMAMLAPAAPAQEKKAAKAAPKTEQAMPGCGMHGMAAGAAEKAPAGKGGCAMMGGAAAAKPGCAMGAGKGAGCGMGGGKMDCCCMQGCCGMAKGGCGAKGAGAGMSCGMKGAGPGKGGCGMMGAGAGMGGPGMCGGPMGGGMGPCGPDMGLGCGPGMMRALDLSPDQQKKVVDICERHQRLTISSQADIRVAELDLAKAVRDERPDRSKIGALIDTIARLRSNLVKAGMNAQLDVRALLTPEQLKKWLAGPDGPMGCMDAGPDGFEN